MTYRLQVGVPEGSPTVEVDGVRLAYVREGRGRPVVCLHAIAHGGRDFEALAAAMQDRCEIIRIDWPGQGRSGPDCQPASARRYGDLLTLVLEALAIRDPIIVGSSIGGGAALHHAARAPVAGLVLCDSAGLVGIDRAVRTVTGLFARFFAAGARRPFWYRPAFAAYYSQVLTTPAAAAQRRRIVDSASETATVLAQAWTSFGQPDADLTALAAGIEAPVWVAWAANDKVIPLSRCRPAIEAMKQAELTTFACGHAAFLEQPETFLEGFQRFLERLPAQATIRAVA